MSVAGVLDPAGATSGYTPAPVTSSNVDTMAAAWDAFTQGNLSNSLSTQTDDAFAARADLIKQRFGKTIPDIAGGKHFPLGIPGSSAFDIQSPFDNVSPVEKYQRQKTDEFIRNGRLTDMANYGDIKTSDEIISTGAAYAKMSERQYADILSRNPSKLAGAAAFIGSMGAQFKDPMNILGMLFGAGEAKLTLKGIAQAGAINAGLVGLSQPGIADWQKKMGNKYGLGDAAESVGEGFLAGMGLHTVLHGAVIPAFRAGKNMLGSASQNILDKMADYWRSPEGAATLPPGEASAAAEAAAYQSRVAHIDEGAPPGAVVDEQSLSLHRDTVTQVATDLENYREPTTIGQEDPHPPIQEGAATKYEDAAHPANEVVPAENVRDPAVDEKFLFKLSEEDLQKQHDAARLSDDEKLVQALGPEGAKKFKQLDRAQNSMDTVRADKAAAQMDEFTKNFTPEQDRLVYGINDHAVIDAESIKTVLQALQDSSFHESDPNSYVAYQAGLAMRNMSPDEILKIPTEGGSPKQQGQFLKLMRGFEELKKRGLSSEQIGQEFIKGMVEHAGMKPNDAADFVGSFFDRLKEVDPRRALGNEAPRQPFADDIMTPTENGVERFDATTSPEKVEPLPSPREIAENDRLAQKRANFDQLLAEDPQMLVMLEDGSAMTLKQLAAKVKGDMDAIEAITTCRLA